MEKIVIIGAGGHAKTIVDSIERNREYEIAGFLSNEGVGHSIYRGYKVIGGDSEAPEVYNRGVKKAVLALGFLGESSLREKLYAYYSNIGFEFPTIVDNTAIVSKDAHIGKGTYIGRNAVINVEASVGDFCIVNTSAVVEHECVVEDFSHVSVSAVLCGQVSVGRNTFIGANSTVIQCRKVGSNCIVGANVVVHKDLTNDSRLIK